MANSMNAQLYVSVSVCLPVHKSSIYLMYLLSTYNHPFSVPKWRNWGSVMQTLIYRSCLCGEEGCVDNLRTLCFSGNE